MAAQKFLTFLSNTWHLISGVVISAGAANAGDLVALNDDGKLDESVMPSGIGAETASFPASENLASGDQVNIWNDAGTLRVRKADATAAGKRSHGVVKAAVTSGASALVYLPGITLTGLTGLTAGAHYFLGTTPGAIVTDVSAYVAGNVIQRVGHALSTTSLYFAPDEPVIIG